MRRNRYLVFLCVLIVLSTCLHANVVEEKILKPNLFTNPGFEQPLTSESSAPAFWETTGTISYDNPHSGRACLKFVVSSNYVSAVQSVTLKKDTFYRLRFWYRTDAPEPWRQRCFDEKTRFYPVRISRSPWDKISLGNGMDVRGYGHGWVQVTQYLYTLDSGMFKLGVTFNREPGVTEAFVDDFSLTEMTEDDIQREQLLEDPGFEKGGYAFLCGSKTPEVYSDIEIVHDTFQFFDGRACLRITNRNPVTFATPSIPVIPGKTYVLSVWMKSAVANTLVNLSVDGWIPNYPHWYVSSTVPVGTRWKQYTLYIKVPAPGEPEYAPERKFVFLKLGIQTPTTLWIDELHFVIKGEK